MPDLAELRHGLPSTVTSPWNHPQ